MTAASPPAAPAAAKPVAAKPVAAKPVAASSPPASSTAAPDWQGKLIARLIQVRRYPRSALAHRQEGIVYLHVRMDRAGHVLSADIATSSGIDALDDETLALIHRADPLPPPPAEVTGDQIDLTVPIQFSLSR